MVIINQHTCLLKETQHGVSLLKVNSSTYTAVFYSPYDKLLDLSAPLYSFLHHKRVHITEDLHGGYCQLVLSQFVEIHLTLEVH